jgi:hypothetical protein
VPESATRGHSRWRSARETLGAGDAPHHWDSHGSLVSSRCGQPATEWHLHATRSHPIDIARALTSPSILLLYGLSLIATLVAYTTT